MKKYENMKIEQKYAKVGWRGQVVIPKRMREEEGIAPNQIVRIIKEPGQIVIRKMTSAKLPEDTILEIFSKAKFTNRDWERIHKEREER